VHIQTVLESTQKLTLQEQEEQKNRIMEKMEQTLKKREEQLNSLKERLQDHVSAYLQTSEESSS
jgi:stress response protein YsnF